MSDSSGGVAPAARTHEFLPSADVYWQGGQDSFSEGFATGANFSMAAMGAVVHGIANLGMAQARGNFGGR